MVSFGLHRFFYTTSRYSTPCCFANGCQSAPVSAGNGPRARFAAVAVMVCGGCLYNGLLCPWALGTPCRRFWLRRARMTLRACPVAQFLDMPSVAVRAAVRRKLGRVAPVMQPAAPSSVAAGSPLSRARRRCWPEAVRQWGITLGGAGRRPGGRVADIRGLSCHQRNRPPRRQSRRRRRWSATVSTC